MSDSIENLKNSWQAAKKDHQQRPSNTDHLIDLAKAKMKSAVYMHIKNIAVLILTLAGLVAFFIYVAPFEHILSHLGIALMLGGLLIRILIEGYSIHLSSKIDISASVSDVNQQYLDFYAYRKHIHGVITISILIAYSVGFYMLIPEFSLYFSQSIIILLCLSYPLAAVLFGFFIRKGIRGEMRFLDELIDVREAIKQ